MIEKVRPLEKGLMVVAGSTFPEDLNLRAWLLQRLKAREETWVIAAAFGLAAHLGLDEDLEMPLMVQVMKLPKMSSARIAIQLILCRWKSSDGSAECKECKNAHK